MENKANHGQIAIEAMIVTFALVLILAKLNTGDSSYHKLHENVNQDELRKINL